MKKRTQNILIELLLVFFILANFVVFGTASGYYGSNTLYVIRVMPNDRNLATQKIKAMGSEWAREEFNWQTLNPRRNRYDLANADQAVATYRRNGTKVVGMLAYSSLWGSSHPEKGTDAQFYKPNIEDWKKYVSVIVRRYGNYVKDWEIWNEPNAFWKPNASPEEYREVLTAAYDTIKSIDPAAKVGSGGTSYIDLDYINRFLNDGGWEHLDAISVHYYPGVGPESDPNNKLRNELSRLVYELMIPRGGGKEIWITEMGWESGKIGTEAQGEVISRALILARTINEVTKIMVYNLRDESGNSYGLMNNNFTPKPAYNYYKKTVEFLADKRISQWFDLDNESKFYIFNGASGATAAAWNPRGGQITGFHVNASGMRCYDLSGNDVSSAVIMAWNNGDVTFSFGSRPVFCNLDNYYVAQTDEEKLAEKKLQPQVAGIANLNSVTRNENLAHISGTVNGFLKRINGGSVTVYKNENNRYSKYTQVATIGNNYDITLPPGEYRLSYEIPGFLRLNSPGIRVAGASDIEVEANLVSLWFAYAILIGGIFVLVLFIAKYARPHHNRT